MKAAKTTIKVLIILFTSIWGLFFGILAPIILMTGEVNPELHYIFIIWLVMAVMGYFVPCFLIMLNLSRIAAVFSVTGTVLALFIHSQLAPLRIAQAASDASFMYLPQIFITILTIIYVFITNPHYLQDMNQKRIDKHNAPAPSILDKKEKKD